MKEILTEQRMNCLKAFDNNIESYTNAILERSEDGDLQKLRLAILNAPLPQAIQVEAKVKVNFAEIKEMRKDAQTVIDLLKWYDSTNPKHKDNAIDAILLLARHIEVLTNE